LAIAVLALLIGFGLFLAGAHLWAWHNYSAAEEALAIGDYQEAEKYLNRCLTFWSGNGQVHYWMARTARALGQFDKARHHLDKCQELDWSPSAIEMEETLLRAQQGEFSELEQTLIEWAKEENESTAAVLEMLCVHYVKNVQLVPALYWGERFLKYYPNNANAQFGLGRIFDASHNPTDAVRYYRRAVETIPSNNAWRHAYARALLTYKQPGEALVQFQELQTRGFSAELVCLGLAQSYRGLGRNKEARALLEQLTADYSQNGEVWIERGKLAWQEGNREEAEKCYRKAFAIRPCDETTVYSLYLCLRQKGQAARAEANELHARYKQLRRDLKRLHHLITHQMSLGGNDPVVVFEVATLLQRLGDDKAAAYWFRKTLKLQPDHPGARKALALESKNTARQADR
jgi:tetratricopeptide (TPR) repeat protein